MVRTRIKNILESAEDNKAVTLSGWTKSKRVSKSVAFIVINDGSTQSDIQCVADLEVVGVDLIQGVSTGCSLRIDGILKESPGKGQKWEVHVNALEVLGSVGEEYPLQKKGHTMEFMRQNAHIRGRSNTFGAVFRVRNQLAFLVHQFFQEKNFQWVHTPILTASDCEGAGEMFQVTTMNLKNIPTSEKGEVDYSKDFFGKPAHLTVSGQLNGEALALSIGDIYTFGPTFRAENSNTTRHLAEFWMIEPEMAFANLHDNTVLAEEFLRYLMCNIVEKCPEELTFLSKHFKSMSLDEIKSLGSGSFGRISYTDAIKELEQAKVKFEFPVKWGVDLQTEHEKYLSEQVFKGPVIVTDYPKDIKAFYMRLNADEKTVAAMDVLVPRIGEIIGGSQREDRLNLLKERAQSVGLPEQELGWYYDLRRYGGCPHAGFGLGFDRLVQYLTGMANIRDVLPFPRAAQSIEF